MDSTSCCVLTKKALLGCACAVRRPSSDFPVPRNLRYRVSGVRFNLQLFDKALQTSALGSGEPCPFGTAAVAPIKPMAMSPRQYALAWREFSLRCGVGTADFCFDLLERDSGLERRVLLVGHTACALASNKNQLILKSPSRPRLAWLHERVKGI